MERRTVNFDDLNSKKDLNIIFTKLTLGDATPKIMTVDIPYSDGTMDYTDYFGRVKYNNRQISMEFNIPLFEKHMDIYHKVQRYLNGRTRKITLSSDRPWYYYGRLTVGQLSCDDGVWNFEITADCQPYQYQDVAKCLEMKTSDNTIVAKIYYDEERPDNPVVKTTIPIKIEKESVTVLLSPGEHIIPQFQITQGDNELVITSLAAEPGTIEIKFKKGRL